MLKEFAELYRYRELLLTLVVRDIKVRYKNSLLGFFWSLLNPLLQVATITFAFRRILSVDIPNYSAYLLCAFLPWTFFQMSMMDSSMSVLLHAGLVKKSYFPREILPASIVLSNLVHFLLALVVLSVYMVVVGIPITAKVLLLPVLVIIQLFFNMGMALFVSCLNVFYEDIKYLVTIVLNLLLFSMPIMFVIEKVHYSKTIPEAIRPALLAFYYVNPLSLLMTAYRKVLLPPFNTATIHDVPLNPAYIWLAGLTSLLIFLSGYAFFNSKKWVFAERL